MATHKMLFKMWRYSFILPRFDYIYSEGVYKYKKSYFRFVNCLILLLLNLEMYTVDNIDSVVLFVTNSYQLFLYLNTWFTVLVIYLSVNHIEKLSITNRTLTELAKTLGVTKITKTKRSEWKWLIFI